MAKIFLSPSNQFENRYAAGNTNEGKQMGLVAQILKVALERHGFSVMLMHDETMAEKVRAADKWGADLYIPIHSNACNSNVAGTRMFCWSKPGKGYSACMDIFHYLAPLTPGESESIKVDQTLYEIKYPDAPVAYIEVDFHDVASVALWIISHTADIAEAICHGICDYFGVKYDKPSVDMCEVSLPILRNGDRNNYVLSLQILLNRLHGASLVEDGIFGSATEAAVRKLQLSSGIGVDGVVGTASWPVVLR